RDPIVLPRRWPHCSYCPRQHHPCRVAQHQDPNRLRRGSRRPAGRLSQGKCMRFEGTSGYVASDDLKVAVNAAIALERPLLVKGEPGTGKTVLAIEIAKSLAAPLLEWHVKSTTKALQALHEYHAVSRPRASQLRDARVHAIPNYHE